MSSAAQSANTRKVEKEEEGGMAGRNGTGNAGEWQAGGGVFENRAMKAGRALVMPGNMASPSINVWHGSLNVTVNQCLENLRK